MTYKAEAVIGGNYGDEGKGIMVDYFARKMSRAIVVRYNGGAQAGHTVVDGEYRHVFHHVGSGTMAGLPTYLSRFFVLNPILFAMEWPEVARWSPRVYVDTGCLVTTHYDMAVNQITEMRRGASRHGSCGVGFGETVGRHEAFAQSGSELTFSDFLFPESRRAALSRIRDYFMLRVGEPQSDDEESIYDAVCGASIEQRFLEGVDSLLAHTLVWHPDDLKGDVIFEGAQGLLLDQRGADFPHVTRSSTGLDNVLELLSTDFPQVSRLTVNYVTRAYLTRHGAGPLPHEQAVGLKNTENETNRHGEFQGVFRYAPLDVDAFLARANTDFAKVAFHTRLQVRQNFAMTCTDQLLDTVPVAHKGVVTYIERRRFIKEAELGFAHLSYGPTASDVYRTRGPI